MKEFMKLESQRLRLGRWWSRMKGRMREGWKTDVGNLSGKDEGIRINKTSWLRLVFLFKFNSISILEKFGPLFNSTNKTV